MRHNMVIYVRHTRRCPHRAKGRNWNRCGCPVYLDTRRNGKRIHHALGTNDWQTGLRLVGNMETEKEPLQRSVREAVEEWESQLEIAPATKQKYIRLGRQLQAWCEEHNVLAADLTVELLGQFRAGRMEKISRSTSVRELQTLRQFCAFLQARAWIKDNPAKAIRAPKVAPSPVLPFTEEEMGAILRACDKVGQRPYERLRARALILVMRYTGLAIGDALMLRRDAIQPDGYLMVYRRKTAQPVRLRVPAAVISALQAVPLPRKRVPLPRRGAGLTSSIQESDLGQPGAPGGYFFWNGIISVKGLVGSIGERLMGVIKRISGVPNFHAHRFRHTLAVSILGKGGTLEDVARVLGNTPAVAYRHYAPWCKQIEQRIQDVMDLVHGAPAMEQKPKTERVM